MTRIVERGMPTREVILAIGETGRRGKRLARVVETLKQEETRRHPAELLVQRGKRGLRRLPPQLQDL
jgi:hypothetical protein